MRTSRHKKGVALVLTLAMLVLITILVVGLSSILTTERTSSRGGLDNQRSKLMAELARDHAIAVLRDGIDGGRGTGKFWSSQPGKITVFNSDGTVDTTSSRTLSSGYDTTSPEVDLNQAFFGGNNPIASAASVNAMNAPTMPVNWINVLSDPTSTSGVANPVVGRYAFWVDDETSKINVNTADGTSKYIDPDYATAASSAPVSFGNGSPTEVSLQALTNSAASANITSATAQNIASITGVRPGASSTRNFSSATEILQPTGVPSNIYQDNNFDLTHYSRSPELNIFGEPKIYLMTVGTASTDGIPLNLSLGAWGNSPGPLTGLPLQQVYPSSDQCWIQKPGTGASFIYMQAAANNPGNPPNNGNQLPAFVFNSNINAADNALFQSYPPLALPQYFGADDASNPLGWILAEKPYKGLNWVMGCRIAQYLKGYNSQGNPINWPPFQGTKADGHGLTGFVGKYTDRQIDSIALQIVDLMTKDTIMYTDGSFCDSSVLPMGFISGLPVKGLGRIPHLNEVLLTFTVTGGNPPKISFGATTQWYLPREYRGRDYGNKNGWLLGPFSNVLPVFNWQDLPTFDTNLKEDPTLHPYAPSPLGILPLPPGMPVPAGSGYWCDQLLKITGQDNQDAGVDWFGNDPKIADPDQKSAEKFHPKAIYNVPPTDPTYDPALVGQYLGTGPVNGYCSPGLFGGYGFGGTGNWNLGDYCVQVSYPPTLYSMRSTPNDLNPQLPALTSITITGGIAVFTNEMIDPTPLDCIRGYVGPAANQQFGSVDTEDINDPKVKAGVLGAVIPLPPGGLEIDVPPDGETITRYVLMKVADPLVNNFSGDWISIADPDLNDSADFTVMTYGATSGNHEYPNGAPTEFQAAHGGDPSAYWLPEVNQNIPKSAQFPSNGYLQYIRTGLMPDPANDPNDSRYVATFNALGMTNAPHGTPFRLLSMAPSYDPAHTTQGNPGQTTAGGASYPDWAMLDLFTVPVSPQPLGNTATSAPPYIEMTYGGSTPGRVNLNSTSALSPFNPALSRLVPLEAVFKNLQVSTNYGAATPNIPETPVSASVDEKALAAAISTYAASLKDANGNSRPFLMPGELANVPAMTNYLYNPSVAPAQSYSSRNDLMRQSVGNLTTQSNTFSVWAIGQSLKQRPDGTLLVLGEARTHYVVERYIDLGTDGVPGNAKAGGAGPDGIVGTADDYVDGDDTANPPVPGANPIMGYPLPYKYRVVASEEVAK